MISLKKTIRATYMCLKYPFLFPRNRFTGLHYNNWKIIDFHRENYKKAFSSICVTTCHIRELEDKQLYRTTTVGRFMMDSWVNPSNELIINLYKIDTSIIDAIIHEKTFKIKIEHKVIDYGFTLGHNGNFYIAVGDNDEIKNKLSFIKYTTDYMLAAKIKILDFIHNYPLQWINCIPTYTEWDTMERLTGWNKAFGDRLLNDIRKQLVKDHMLYSWRIMDIKEKYGSLRIYCNFATHELYELLDKYEEISYHTCYECGEPAKYMTGGYILPYCEKHFPKDEIPYKEIVDGKWQYTNPEDNNY